MNWTGCLVSAGGVQNVATIDCIPVIINNLINAALLFAGVVAVFFIVWAGAKFVTSGGDAKQVQGAQQTLSLAIVGLIVVLLSFFIINLLSYITGVSCINQFGFGQCSQNPKPPIP